MATNKKPLGIVLIALYSGFFGLASLPLGCTAVFLGAMPGAGMTASFLGYAALLIGFVGIASAYGLWTMQEWGHRITFWLYLIAIPLGILAIFPVFTGQKMTAGNTVFQLVGIAIDAAVLSYLKTSYVKALFTGDSSSLGAWERQEPL